MGIGESKNVFHHMFIHNVLAHFYKDTLDYFSEYLYPRFEWTVMGTYTKAIEYMNKTAQEGREVDKPNLPALILNPSGEFEIGGGDMGARQLFRFPNLAPGLISRIYDPIYQDNNIQITMGFSRVIGDIELIILPSSFYEYCDIRIYMQQIFGGPPGSGRPITPNFFHSFIIIPDELKNYTYTNEYTGDSYQLNWESALASNKLVETTNKNELTIPCQIKPLYRLNSMSDASDKYGGTDNIAEYKLSATVSFEIELPSFMLIQSDYIAENINFNFGYGSAFTVHSDFSNEIPINQEIIQTHWDSPLDETSHTTVELIDPVDGTTYTSTNLVYPETPDSKKMISINLINRYHHVITANDMVNDDFFIITLPHIIEDRPELIKVMSKKGILKYGDHYQIINNGSNLKIIQEKIKLSENDILELYIYKETFSRET